MERCAELTDFEVLNLVEKYLKGGTGPEDPAWRWCAEYVTNYGKGKPAQSVTKADQDPVTVRVVYADELSLDGDE